MMVPYFLLDETTLEALAQLNAFPSIINNLLLPSSVKFMKFLQFITYNLSLYGELFDAEYFLVLSYYNNTEQNWDSLRHAGAIQALCSILADNKEESSLKMAVKILASLSADGENRELVQQCGGLQRSLALLDDSHPSHDIIKVLVHFSRTGIQ